jgi:hypothetical protein
VQYDMLRFLTKHVRAAAIVKSVEIVGGTRTIITVPGMKLKFFFCYSCFSFFSLHCFR